jgi:hypothetical protein
MSELNLDGQVEAFFDTFAAASGHLDVDRLAELFTAAGIDRVVLADLQHQALDDTYVLARTEWRGERAGLRGPRARGRGQRASPAVTRRTRPGNPRRGGRRRRPGPQG